MLRFFLFFLLLGVIPVLGAESVTVPTMNFELSAPKSPEQLVSSLNVLVLLTLLFLAPSMVLVMTTFTRFVIVFGFLRQAMGTQQVPPTQLLVMLAMILTFFVMEPVGTKAYEDGIKPYVEKKIGYEEAFDKTAMPFKNFMIRNTREKDLALFFRIRKMENPSSIAAVPLSIIIPAFVISELKTAFEIGFLLFLPFLVIDMVVASILMSMGMMMLPPVMIALPFKILIFVLIDGWSLLIGNLIASVK
ncbi:MAG: flagellar biosynthetic protein FliP [Sulfurimonas sp. RIFOXYD12_FULL_36_11]|jgi:flagellar biosynthetic protein FliP|uniref:flagellar type III secretion system pore protein FliP n=1 Tax=unclassified Sulfurimonas TaxID=2623549 RepID=UPI0008CED973|nr:MULTISPECIES: flagellar type III secretion system pore protein FliP [unclassified Sulfurimonas]MBS4068705.1 flagellar type III secretion system pore protein FliP [Sulfurimonas sp.]MDD3855874.1 flagellar type III secretion system pore protein FliP [Sulfurimonas sp.]OHE03701.1 MAG: flagellar biosynthetic protein FliP [Sulfurimonas sp. RIFOXYB12_FULL_35_9]OHE12347.1 MAG: flagellar biosynthetic protein FliP [Sulfurimonas sp. RIFOXYD12_FULL_36_11]